MKKKHIFIISISSDIGAELAKYWLSQGHSVSGTIRKKSILTDNLEKLGVDLFKLDLASIESCEKFLEKLPNNYRWDSLVVGAGDQSPIGSFLKTNFESWESSLRINFVGQMQILQGMISHANIKSKNSPVCIFFAGGGTNGAVINYSAYTISKIASIKMMELLDAEISQIAFTIVGPGWVKTKIHQATLDASFETVGENFFKTKQMLDNDLCFPIERVVKCCDWLIYQKRDLIGGRNFSAEHDPWDDKKILKIADDPNIFKLRRHGNNLFK